MRSHHDIEVRFVAGFGPVVRDVAESHELYADLLGIAFEEDAAGYPHTGALAGVNHFALWPLARAAESCFGDDEWPDDVPAPQAWIEFDVDDVAAATDALRDDGYALLVENREEPWGQTVTRLLGPDGLLVGITYTPWMRDDADTADAGADVDGDADADGAPEDE